MKLNEIKKSKAFTAPDVIEYVPHTIVSKVILKKLTGNISVAALDSGEGFTKSTSPFDTFVQIIDGKAEILIDEKSHLLETGQSIVIPAHSSNAIKANIRFKMISTVIKSGYE